MSDFKISSSSLENIFNFLAKRNWSENKISDLLYAIINGDKECKNAFLDLITVKAEENGINWTFSNEDFIEAEREFPILEGRPDFKIHFRNEVKKLFVEVKINDENYHYKQYSHNKQNMVVLLTKKVLNKNEFKGWILITWDELLKTFEMINSELITIFIKLFRRILKMAEIKEIKNFNIGSLYHLNNMIHHVIIKNQYIIDHKLKSFKDDGSGYIFHLPLNTTSIYPWLGINYNPFYPTIVMFWLQDNNHHKSLIKKLFDQEFNGIKLIVNNNEAVFIPNEKEWEKFLEYNLDDQIKFIDKFFKLVIDIIKVYE